MDNEIVLPESVSVVVETPGKEVVTSVLETSSPTPEDMAAHDFRLLIPKFWDKIEPMSRRQQQRVFKALIEYPLETNFPKFSYPEEKEAFYIGLQINDCKFVLQKTVFDLVQNKEAMEAFKLDLEKVKEDNTNGV